MREIKFRGKDVDTNIWVYGSYFKHKKLDVFFATEIEEKNNIQHLIVQDKLACDWNFKNGIKLVDVDEYTVGQFTGLYDKNGKEIYEGDIVKMRLGCELCDQTEYDIVCKITYGLLGYGSQIGFSGEAKDGQAISLAGQGFLEVIGNIYDNPELLER